MQDQNIFGKKFSQSGLVNKANRPNNFAKIDLHVNISSPPTTHSRKRWNTLRNFPQKESPSPENLSHRKQNNKIRTDVYNHCNEENLSECILNYLSRINADTSPKLESI